MVSSAFALSGCFCIRLSKLLIARYVSLAYILPSGTYCESLTTSSILVLALFFQLMRIGRVWLIQRHVTNCARSLPFFFFPVCFPDSSVQRNKGFFITFLKLTPSLKQLFEFQPSGVCRSIARPGKKEGRERQMGGAASDQVDQVVLWTCGQRTSNADLRVFNAIARQSCRSPGQMCIDVDGHVVSAHCVRPDKQIVAHIYKVLQKWDCLDGVFWFPVSFSFAAASSSSKQKTILPPDVLRLGPGLLLLDGPTDSSAPIGSSTQLHCSRKGVSNHIATPKVSMASSLLQQGNNLHQTCFLAQTSFPLCQLQCVGWHIAEMRGREERVETESWLHHSLLWPALAVQPSMGTFAFGEANSLFMAARGWC